MSVIVKCGGGENVTPEVTAQTPVITQILEGLVGKAQGANATAETILEGYSAYVGQTLVNGTYLPHGAYVWKKYEYTPAVTVENPSITVTHGGSITTFPITDANFDLTKVSDYEKFFDGFIGGTTYPNISYGTSTFKLYFKENSTFQPTIDSFVADSETTGSFVVSSTTSVTPTSTTFSYSGTKELSEASIGAFVDFVVSDQETAYLDGGEQGGYWYEKVVGFDKLGFEKVSYGTFTNTSYGLNFDITHNLGVKPKKIIIARVSDEPFVGHVFNGLILEISGSSILGGGTMLRSDETIPRSFQIGNTTYTTISETQCKCHIDFSYVTTTKYSQNIYFAPTTYHWLALA